MVQGNLNDLFSTTKTNDVLAHNVRTLPRYVDEIVSDNRIMNNNIIGFTETQISSYQQNIRKVEVFQY